MSDYTVIFLLAYFGAWMGWFAMSLHEIQKELKELNKSD